MTTDHLLPAPDSVKLTRETLSVAQNAVTQAWGEFERRDEHVARLQALIDACDAHRPLGPDGTHGDRHTPTCGCAATRSCPTCGWTPSDPDERVTGACGPGYHTLALVPPA